MDAKVSVSSHRTGSSESSCSNRFCRRSSLVIPRPQGPLSYADSSPINWCLCYLHRFYQLVVGWERLSIPDSGKYQGWITGVSIPGSGRYCCLVAEDNFTDIESVSAEDTTDRSWETDIPNSIFSFSARGSTVVSVNAVPVHTMKVYSGRRGMPLLILRVTSSQLDASAALTPNGVTRRIGGWVETVWTVWRRKKISCLYRGWNPG